MGFFKWFTQRAKMKRWMALILLGMVLVCYGLSTLLYHDSLKTMQIVQIVVSFVTGFTIIVIGFVFMQRRNLELLVEESDTRKDATKDAQIVNSLIFNKKVYNQGPKIVVIGGGTGINTVLRGLKNYTDNITAIVTVSEYGKKPTDSRKSLNILPLQNIKESLIALSYNEEQMEKLLNNQFETGPLKSLTFGDIYFSTMNNICQNAANSIENSGEVLNITGKVLPVTLEEIKICAELSDGMVIEDKDKISDYVSEKACEISRVYISPTNTNPAPGVIEAIKEADAIVIGPGSLYTNVIPNLLVKGIAKAIKESEGIKIYVSNIMTELGQTDEYSLSDYIRVINEYVGYKVIDYCIYDTGEIIPEVIKQYNLKGSDIVLPDIQKSKEMGIQLVQRNLSKVVDGNVIHDPNEIAEAIIQLVCDELEFRDMQNGSQYALLNSKLKERKAERKHNKDTKVTVKKPLFERRPTETKSKFNIKYQERIDSIKGIKTTTSTSTIDKKTNNEDAKPKRMGINKIDNLVNKVKSKTGAKEKSEKLAKRFKK